MNWSNDPLGMDLSRFRILDGEELRPPESLRELMIWFADASNYIVEQTTWYVEVAGEKGEKITVSTVCLPVEYWMGMWFETMVFGGLHDLEQERYATLDEAREGHARTVARVRADEEALRLVKEFLHEDD